MAQLVMGSGALEDTDSAAVFRLREVP